MHRFDHESPLEDSPLAFENLVRQGKVNLHWLLRMERWGDQGRSADS